MYREIPSLQPVKVLDSLGNIANLDEETGTSPKRQIVCGVQYIILVDRSQKTIVTELWVEPVLRESADIGSLDLDILFKEFHESIAKDLVQADSRLFESLYTFDRIHSIGRNGQITADAERSRNLKRGNSPHGSVVGEVCAIAGSKLVEATEPGRKSSIMQTSYNIESVLHKAEFHCLLYSPPKVLGSSVVDVALSSELNPTTPCSPLMAVKSEGDLAVSRGTSPNVLLDSPRGSISNDHIFNRRNSQAFSLGKAPPSLTVTKPVLSIGLNWDMLLSCTPAARIRLLLFKFFQNMMNFVTDGEVAFTVTPRRKNSTFSVRSQEVLEADVRNSGGLEETLFEKIKHIISESIKNINIFAPQIEEMLCYVKIRSPEQFILTFLPKPMNYSDFQNGAALSITMVQCSRLQVHSSSSGRERLAATGFNQCPTKAVADILNWTLLVKESDFGADTVPDGTIILKGDTGSVSASVQPAEDEYDVASLEYVDNYVQSITAAFGNAHCQSVYAALLQNLEVTSADIEKALAGCVEIVVDIDLTYYMNVLTLRHKYMSNDDIRLDKIDILTLVRAAIIKHFKQVPGSADLRNVYFLNPNDGADGCLTPSRIDCAESPLFIRTEFIIRKGQDNFQTPAVAIPTSYVVSDLSTWDLENANSSMFPVDFTPRAIGTEENPIQSVDGTSATLQIVCLCLIKPSKYDASYDDPIEVHEKELDDPRIILTRDKVNALYSTVDQIKEVLENEVINGLLELPSKAERFTLDYIKDRLSERHRIPSNFGERDVSDVSATCICDFPLVLVGNLPSLELLSQEFSKCAAFKAPAAAIQQLNEIFLVTVNSDWEFGASSPSEANQGLGISLATDEYLVRSVHMDSTKKNCAIVAFKTGYARIWYFSRFTPPEERLRTLKWIQSTINDTCNRISRLLLLQQLKIRHRASKLLIDRNAVDDASDDEDEEDESGLELNLESFKNNQFSCPLVFSRQFSIHWRVKPSLALNAAVASITILAITNRKNMFVFEDGETILYFKLSIKEVEGEFSPIESSRKSSMDDLITPMDALPPIKDATDSPKAMSPVLTRGKSSNINTPSTKSTESFLLLEFFGIDAPDPSTTTPFVSMIESKLSSLTQREIATYMSRNMKAVRLTPADVEFILPTLKGPQKREFFKFPSLLDVPFKFLLYLKQALLTSLTPLPANDISSVLSTYYIESYKIASLNSDLVKSTSQDINFGEFAFLYNSLLPRGASRFETNIGAGTAVVSIALLDSARRIITRTSEPMQQTETGGFDMGIDMAKILIGDKRQALRLTDFDMCLHDDAPLMLLVEIWSHGAINKDALMEFVFKCYCDSILDYCTEKCIGQFSNTLAQSRPASSISQLDIIKSLSSSVTRKVDPFLGQFFDVILKHLKLSSQLCNSVVEELSSPIKLPPSIMDGLAAETKDLLIETSPVFNPVMFTRQVNGRGEVELDLYVPKTGKSDTSDRQILILAGLQELQDIYGVPSSAKASPVSSGAQTPIRHQSISEISSNESSLHQSIRNNQGFSSHISQARREELDNIMCLPSAVNLTSASFGLRHGIFVMMIESNKISVATYNINKSSCEDLFNHIIRILSWNNIRMQFLEHGFGFDHSHLLQDPFRSDREKHQTPIKPTTSGIDYSSSYAGIGGLGHAAMRHFEKRLFGKDNAQENAEADRLQKMYNINASSLQKSAVSLLDAYVRHGGLFGAPGQRSTTPDYMIRHGKDNDEFLKNPKSQSNGFLDEESGLSSADLAAVLRSVRLHFVHYPIFFSSLRETLLTSEVDEVGDGVTNQQQIEAWFRQMLAKFYGDYAEYLASLGFEVLEKDCFKAKDDEWISNPTFSVAKDITFEVEPTYYLKQTEGGVFILQIGVDGFCVAVNLYMLKYPSGPLNPFDEGMRYGAEKDIDRQFKSDSLYYKGSLHVHSFLRLPHSLLSIHSGQSTQLHH
ncbi:hypothetical protein BDR26DRAFT_213244 [Obelidium mucronatum]|nr:hypothetical protein BDR26DRAFT_213244 [Obelidium mucronatum]